MNSSTAQGERSWARTLLVSMLQEAAKLEHCLLASYLYAACSLKSTPQEFAAIGGQENRRRALHFERVRGWKQKILAISHEEMRHLHYVQCMIRGLGERPFLGLPKRDTKGAWLIPNWKIHESTLDTSADGMRVPVRPLDENLLKSFVSFESTDALQDSDLFGAGDMALFERLYRLELAIRFESMLVNITDEAIRTELRTKLFALYDKTLPVEAHVAARNSVSVSEYLPPDSEMFQFQSIADFYIKGILPLYEQAFAESWVVMSGRNLVDEQLNPNYAAEGFLPVGPIGRSARFSRFANKMNANPLADYRQVSDIVREIVSEGEGASDFASRAESMLAKIDEIGIAKFLAALARDAKHANEGKGSPDWLADAQNVRNSHLYLFAMILVEYRVEQSLSKSCGVSFSPSRDIQGAGDPHMAKIASELPAQFNSCYVAMLAWLSRMYESRSWASDKSRRMAIEMVATWPLMSLAIRPFLELASFFEIDPSQLFRVESSSVPMLPVWTQELVQLYESPARSEAINERMDWLVVRALKAAAAWAAEQLRTVAASDIPAHEREMIVSRLRALSHLDEFEQQFSYRVAGGYSDRSPDLSYRNQHPKASQFEEDPTTVKPLFGTELVMRMRFRGWGLVQLATDPDPPTDESGCSGTLMLHAADGDRRFDRALVFQNNDSGLNIRRSLAPPLGVDCVEVALMVPDLVHGAVAGYKPLQVLSSSGAIQTSGVQQVLSVEGLREVAKIDAKAVLGDGRAIQLFLESKDAVRPFLNGDNHLVWQDGEPIDPFILGIYAGPSTDGNTPATQLFQREIFNHGLSIREMEPYQRLLSCRGPSGFDSIANLPAWAVTQEVAEALQRPDFPMSFLRQRSTDLASELGTALASNCATRESVDVAVSLAERLLLVAQPRGTTIGWLGALLHYGHTVSGKLDIQPGPNPVLSSLEAGTGLRLSVAGADPKRDMNSRWLINYAKGLMDVDAISDFVIAELYVPLSSAGELVRFERSWRFPSNMLDVVASYACKFVQPFWARFDVRNDTRSIQVQGLVAHDPKALSTLVETLVEETANGYAYDQTGFPGMVSYRGELKLKLGLESGGEAAILHWICEFQAADAGQMVHCYALLAGAADQMGASLAARFSPSDAT